MTYGSEGHFICTIKMSHPLMKYTGWYLHDDIVEKRKQGVGLQYLIGMPNIPATWKISYVVYLKKD